MASDSADVRYVRELLQSRLDCGLPLDRAHCAEIWRRTADVFLTRDVPCPSEPPRLPCPAIPLFSGTEAESVTDCPPLCGAGSWAEWEANKKSPRRCGGGAGSVACRIPRKKNEPVAGGADSLRRGSRSRRGSSTADRFPCGLLHGGTAVGSGQRLRSERGSRPCGADRPPPRGDAAADLAFFSRCRARPRNIGLGSAPDPRAARGRADSYQSYCVSFPAVCRPSKLPCRRTS